MQTSSPARFVWSEPANSSRNAYALFRRRFSLNVLPLSAELNVYADSRYRLFVNNQRVGYGPIRGIPRFPEYDTIDLKPWLKTGSNEILVEVNSRNGPSFQCAPDCRSGFIAWGKITSCDDKALDLSTPGDWSSKTSLARDPMAQAYTFTLPPGECLDVGLLRREISEEANWNPPAEISDGPWGEFKPRSIGPAEERYSLPASLRAFELINDEEVLGCSVFVPEPVRKAKGLSHGGFRFMYATWIHSPEAQNVTLGLFWGPHYCNGLPVECKNDAVRGRGARQNGTVHLREGWNLLYGEPEIFTEIWGMLIGLPRAAGLTARATQDLNSPYAMKHGTPLDPDAFEAARSAPPADAQGLERLNVDWRLVKNGVRPPLPARYIAWDLPAGELRGPVTGDTVELPAERPSALLANFDHAVGGWLRVHVDAPAGTVVDAAVCDGLRSDGMVRVCHRPFMENADRYILDGPTDIETFHAQGGHHWQLNIRPPTGSTGKVTVRDLKVRSSCCDLPMSGHFECKEPFFNWLWKASAGTLRASIEDAYIVDSYRERSIYLCDSYVQSLAGRTLTADRSIEYRNLRLIDQIRRVYGGLSGIPSIHTEWKSNSFQMMWILWLHNTWSWTGDAEIVRELFGSVEKVLTSPEKAAPSGLWNDCVFACWGEPLASRKCDENGTLNAFRYGALLAGAEMTDVIGKHDLAERWRVEASRVLAAMTERLWDAQQGCYAAGTVKGGRETADPIHANVVALLTGCYTESNRERLLKWVTARMQTNHEKCFKEEPGRIELNFLMFALHALYRHGETELAEKVMRAHYGFLFERNAISVIETIANAEQSQCIAWTCHPMWWMHTRILGVQLARAGHPNTLIIAPESSSLQSAAGVFPHALGDIHIAWKIDGQKIRVEIKSPPGIVIENVRPAGTLAKYDLETKIIQKPGVPANK